MKGRVKRFGRCRTKSSSIIDNIFGRNKDFSEALSEFEEWIITQHGQCLICDRISNTMNRYAYTTLYLWDTDSEFKKTFNSSRGFCLNHLALTIKIARETMSSKKQALWLADVIPLQIKFFHNLDHELSLFINKFDYRKRINPSAVLKILSRGRFKSLPENTWIDHTLYCSRLTPTDFSTCTASSSGYGFL